jgi:hypothetical protein
VPQQSPEAPVPRAAPAKPVSEIASDFSFFVPHAGGKFLRASQIAKIGEPIRVPVVPV